MMVDGLTWWRTVQVTGVHAQTTVGSSSENGIVHRGRGVGLTRNLKNNPLKSSAPDSRHTMFLLIQTKIYKVGFFYEKNLDLMQNDAYTVN